MIQYFKGKYVFLDNNFEMDIPFQGVWYPTVTHAFFASRTAKERLRTQVAKTQIDQLIHLLPEFEPLPDTWEAPAIMRGLLEAKFGYTHYGQPNVNMMIMKKLIETDGSKLEYGNLTHSTYWGVCHCPDHEGKVNTNVLGGLLMGVRKKWIKFIKHINKNQIMCQCNGLAKSWYLYTIGWNPLLVPYCSNCQVDAIQSAADLSSDKIVVSFREWPDIHGNKIAEPIPLVTVRELQERMHLQDDVDDWDERRRERDASMSSGQRHPGMAGIWQRPAPPTPPEEPRQWKGRVIKC